MSLALASYHTTRTSSSKLVPAMKESSLVPHLQQNLIYTLNLYLRLSNVHTLHNLLIRTYLLDGEYKDQTKDNSNCNI